MRSNRGSVMMCSNIHFLSACLKIRVGWEHGEWPEGLPAVLHNMLQKQQQFECGV